MNEFLMRMARQLHMRFSAIYEDRFYRNHKSDEAISIWCDEWALGLEGINPHHVKAGIDYCRKMLRWPPSIAEFREICFSCSGVLSAADIMQTAIRGDLTNDLVKFVYEKVGGWDFSHDKESVLMAKVSKAREEYLESCSTSVGISNEMHQNLIETKDKDKSMVSMRVGDKV